MNDEPATDDAVDSVGQRDEDDDLTLAAARLAEPSFATVWDNPEDDIYDCACISRST